MTISWKPTLRGLDADQVCRDPIPTTKSLPVLFGNMGQPCAGSMRASFSLLDCDQGNALGCGYVEIFRKYGWQNVYPTATLAPMKKDVGMRVRVNRELRDEFLLACQADDKPAAQVIREFMRAYVESHPVPSRDNAKNKSRGEHADRRNSKQG
ncbi:MAG: hypothetical protein ACJAVO_000180 [Parvibaculaceae bacterium]|jgi:hypothetical protein